MIMRKTKVFLTKLSLKAEKNWHQNRGAKARELNKKNDHLHLETFSEEQNFFHSSFFSLSFSYILCKRNSIFPRKREKKNMFFLFQVNKGLSFLSEWRNINRWKKQKNTVRIDGSFVYTIHSSILKCVTSFRVNIRT